MHHSSRKRFAAACGGALGRVTSHTQTTPDEWTDLSQDDAELIDAGRFKGLIHAQSVPRRALHFKVSLQNLALSYSPAFPCKEMACVKAPMPAPAPITA